MPLASWLFVRNAESIWVERPTQSTLVVAGPGAQRQQRDFIDDNALNAFQVVLAEQLTGDGWFLWPHDTDRRRASAQSALHRGGADRRQPIDVKP